VAQQIDSCDGRASTSAKYQTKAGVAKMRMTIRVMMRRLSQMSFIVIGDWVAALLEIE
jgi:hypothetical protein